MRPVRTFMLGIALGVMSVATLGCPPAGQGEKAGKAIDKAAEEAKAGAKEAADAIKGAASQAKEAAQKAADAVQGAASQPNNP